MTGSCHVNTSACLCPVFPQVMPGVTLSAPGIQVGLFACEVGLFLIVFGPELFGSSVHLKKPTPGVQ